MELPAWKYVFREGFAPLLSRAALEALAGGLRRDDLRLGQGFTTQPPPLLCVADWPCEAACPLGYCGAAENGGFADETPSGKHTNKAAATVGQVEQAFARYCFGCDDRLGEPAACRWFLSWWDDTPRQEAVATLLGEVERALALRPAEAA